MQENENFSLAQLLLTICKKAWIILLASVLLGGGAYLASRYFVVPLYTANVKLYVNNTTEASKAISTSDLTASQSLVGTYIAILRSNVVLDQVAELTEMSYDATQIDGMISAGAIDDTEVFMVSVTNPNPEVCAKIANSIADVATDKIGEIVSGSSVKIVDRAKVPTEISSPNYLANTLAGALTGFVLMTGIVLLTQFLNKRIKAESDLIKISSLPILGMVSDFAQYSRAGLPYSDRK